ncbi:MAG: glycosyltransferase, partial [Nanoarchaeota archaeon]
MRVAFFTDMFLPQVNGVTNAIVQLVKELADRGHSIYIVAPNFPRLQEFSYPNVTVKRCAAIPALFYKDLKLASLFDLSVLNLLRNEEVDVIHFHTPAMLGLQAIIIARLLKLPLVGTFHGFFMDRRYLKHLKLNYGIMESLVWRISNLFYNGCEVVVC